MVIKKNKLIRIALIFLLLFLLLQQGLKIRKIIKERELLWSEITVQQQLNGDLEAEYINHIRSRDLSNVDQSLDLEEKTSEILSELKIFNLELIDFSSSKSELNLNLSGNFTSILNFIYYLETESLLLKIDEFKIKKNQDQLFFYLKLKNELI